MTWWKRVSKLKRDKSKSEKRVREQLESSGLDFGYECEKFEYPVRIRLPLVSVNSAKDIHNPSLWRRMTGNFHEIHTYTPDFFVKTKSGKTVIIEVKGEFNASDREKIRIMKKVYFDKGLDFRMIFDRSKSKFSKTNSKTYGEFCDQYKILYADKEIPNEWLNEFNK